MWEAPQSGRRFRCFVTKTYAYSGLNQDQTRRQAVIRIGFRPSTGVFLNGPTFWIFAVQKDIRYFREMVATITPDQP